MSWPVIITIAAICLIGFGLYYGGALVAADFDEMQDADDFGDVHSEKLP